MAYQHNGQSQTLDFVKGALIGTILGGVTGLLVAPKAGRELREDIIDGITSINDKTHEFTDQICENGRKLTGMFNYEDDEEHTGASFIKGSAAGAVIGAVAALLLAPKAGRKLREDLGDTYDDIRKKAKRFTAQVGNQGQHVMENLEDWKDTLSTIVSKLSHSKGRHGHSRSSEIIDWASLGLRLLQQLQSSRR